MFVVYTIAFPPILFTFIRRVYFTISLPLLHHEENKTIINAVVLGLVFEKINGYRDAPIYTPGAVTMFLCRETIRKAVVKKFNDTYNWHCKTIARNYLLDRRNTEDLLAFNQLIESIRIADPAVGSGHFLVSSLNEIIAIKAELGILADAEGNRLGPHRFLNQFVAFYTRWKEYILNYCQGRYHTSLIEEINNKIKSIKRRAFGFNNFESFKIQVITAFM